MFSVSTAPGQIHNIELPERERERERETEEREIERERERYREREREREREGERRRETTRAYHAPHDFCRSSAYRGFDAQENTELRGI